MTENTLHPYIAANVEQFNGFADLYDKYRPKMPSAILDVLTQAAQIPFPNLVVDVGCGTGLSTRVWRGRARQIIGVEPSDDMRSKAMTVSKNETDVTYIKGTAAEINLPSECADILTICQAIGWLEPNSTFHEVSRIVRPGGIFASVDYSVPVATTIEIQSAERVFLESIKKLMAKHFPNHQAKHWDKEQYLHQMAASGKFTHTEECHIDNVEQANLERIVGINLSQADTQTLLKHGLSEEEIGLSTLRTQLEMILGNESIPMHVTYHIRIGQR